MKNKLLVIFAVLSILACSKKNDRTSVKFEPEDGKCLVIIGQDLGAIGGLEKYNQGYVDNFKVPAGFTIYTNFRPGDTSFGYKYKGLDGIDTINNWGSGDCCARLQCNSEVLKNSVMAIGLELVNHEKEVAIGKSDTMIVKLGNWVASLNPRPVFLRIGYEFDAPQWNHYDSTYYKQAFRRIHHIFDSLKVNNVAYVWQSKGWGSDVNELMRWYPGDDFVDWCAYSHFFPGDGAKPVFEFARLHKKPVFIAEATPLLNDSAGKQMQTFMNNPQQAQLMWKRWFEPFFETIEKNSDIIKAFSYINCNWHTQAMWQTPPFNLSDSRLQADSVIMKNWKNKMADEKYLQASPDLINYLWKK